MGNINSVEELLKLLKKLDINENTFYRGHANHSWELTPSVFRSEFKGTEHQFYLEISQHNPSEFEKQKTLFDQLALMQHYSIPTRLLDWTKNPLVALYFSTENYEENIDGELIIYQPETILSSGTYGEKILSKLVHTSRNESCSFEDFKNEYIDSSFKIADILSDDEENDQALEQLLISPILIKPKITNKRLRSQQGCFTLHGNRIEIKDNKKYINTLESSTVLEQEILCRIRVNRISKLKIREELNFLGINSGTLFPDLENYAVFLKQKLKISNDILAETAVGQE